MEKEKEKDYIILIVANGKAIDMKVIGEIIKKKEKEYFIGMMVIDMKVIIKIIKEKEKEYIIIMMVIDMKEIGKMIKEKEKE